MKLTDEMIVKILEQEKENLQHISENLEQNPMCESCSQYFPGCCACRNCSQ